MEDLKMFGGYDLAEALAKEEANKKTKKTVNKKAKRNKEIIVRIRRTSGYVGGSNYYHHADVICKSKSEALQAAKEGRVTNWRWIDTFDTSNENYDHYEVLYIVTPSVAKRPKVPVAKKS